METLGFSKGLDPVLFRPDKDSITDKNTGKLLKTAEDCGRCHKTAYTNWKQSRHRDAHTNEIYRHSFSLEPMQWCENCHAPLRDEGKLYLKEEGISCNVCHVRNGAIISSRIPERKDRLYHEYETVPDFGTAKLCESCHQFNFPTLNSLSSHANRIEYSELNMQGTFDEWAKSSVAEESNCIDCHLAPNTKRSHLFPGGHTISELKKSFIIEAEYVGPRTISVRILSLGIGHAFPTGDLFRALRLQVKSVSGRTKEEFLLRKLYRNKTKEEKDSSSSPRILESDTRIPAPSEGNQSGWREFFLEASDRPNELEIELWIDYLNDVEKIFSSLKSAETLKNILKERIRIEGRNKFSDKDAG